MHPILLKLGPITLYSYGLMLAVAFLTASWCADRAARRWPAPPARPSREPGRAASTIGGPGPLPSPPLCPDHVAGCCTAMMIGGLIGARLFFVVSHAEAFLSSPLEIVAIWQGGLIWYGGFAGGIFAGWRYLRRRGVPLLRALDQLVPFAALGHGIGRLGCFLNGCCYGQPTSTWCGIALPGSPVRLMPTQLIEAGGLFVLAAILRWWQRPMILRRQGAVFGGYLVLYAVMRFVIEHWRGDQEIVWNGWTVQQWISLGVLLLGVRLLWSAWRAPTD